MKSIKVLGSIRLEEDMEWRPSASDRRWPLISTESLYYLTVQIVPITDLHIVILAHVVKLQAQHGKSWGTRTNSQTAYLCTLNAIYLGIYVFRAYPSQWIYKSLTTQRPLTHFNFCIMLPRSWLNSIQLLHENIQVSEQWNLNWSHTVCSHASGP